MFETIGIKIIIFKKRTSSSVDSKNAIESIAFLSKSMYIMDSNQNAIELITYLLVLVVYFYEFIVCMLLERNAFDSIAFFSQCKKVYVLLFRLFYKVIFLTNRPWKKIKLIL